MKPYRGTVGILALGLWLIGVMLLSPPSFAAAKKYLSLGTGNPSGSYYILGAGLAHLINKHVPEVRVVAESTGGSEENFNLVIRNKMNLGIVTSSVIDPALEKKLDMSGVRLFAMSGVASQRHWFVRKESPIKSLADFKGRRVSVGQPGSGTLISSKEELLAAAGLTFEDIKPAYLSMNESINGIKDGTVDVGVLHAGYPVASLVELSRTVPIRLISYSEEEVKTLIASHPRFVGTIIPAGTYAGINTDTLTTGVRVYIICRKELSDDLIYKMMKALYDNPKELYAIYAQARQWSLENTSQGGADFLAKHIPFHPGAIKFLKEKGVWKDG